jgi:NTP pyrophosphatase (non-canonical NTP hydrolase)
VTSVQVARPVRAVSPDARPGRAAPLLAGLPSPARTLGREVARVTLRPSGIVQARIRLANAANGWDVPTDPAERTAFVARLALAISEVAEAIEVARKRPIDDDHLVEELADVVIRLLDLGSGLGIEVLDDGQSGIDVPGGFDVTSVDGLVASLGVVAATIGRLLDTFVTTISLPPTLGAIANGLKAPCVQIEALALALRLDLAVAVESKIARNVARGFRHGGRAI